MSEEKKYVLRTFEADDIDYLTEIISKLDAEDIIACFDGIDIEKVGNNLQDIGLKVFVKMGLKICKNYRKAKKEIYDLLSGLSGLTPEEVGHLPLPEFVGMIAEVFKKEEFSDCFKVASSFVE